MLNSYDYNTVITKTAEALENRKTRSAWARGVNNYAVDLFQRLTDNIEEGYYNPEVIDNPKDLEEALLSGAADWSDYSWSGFALCYDHDIAEALCSPSELKKDMQRSTPTE